jgi:cyanophycin synthetase
MTSLTGRLPSPIAATHKNVSEHRPGRRWSELISLAARAQQFLVQRRFDSALGPFKALKSSCYEQLWASAAANVGASIENLGHGVSRISRGHRETFVSGSRVMLDGPVTLTMAGNKPLVSRMLQEHGHPVGPFLEFTLGELERAESFLQSLGGPAVVKPGISGASGRGVTLGIRTNRDLRRAAALASTFSRTILVEQQASGPSYRLLYIDGEFIDAIERRPPSITGDGRQTIAQLIRRENLRRLRGVAPLAMQPLVVDVELKRCLADQGLTLSSVIPAGQSAMVKAVVNENTAAENSNVRDRVHPDTIRRGAEIARLLRIRLAGHDVITTDISRPLGETGGVFNEVNTTPGLQHHYLIDDPDCVFPVMDRLLEVLLDDKEWPQGRGDDSSITA